MYTVEVQTIYGQHDFETGENVVKDYTSNHYNTDSKDKSNVRKTIKEDIKQLGEVEGDQLMMIKRSFSLTYSNGKLSKSANDLKLYEDGTYFFSEVASNDDHTKALNLNNLPQ